MCSSDMFSEGRHPYTDRVCIYFQAFDIATSAS